MEGEILRAVLALGEQVAQVRAETTARHAENRRELTKLHSGITEANAGVKRVETQVAAVSAEVKGVKADVAIMKPVVRRLRGRELVRRGVVQCLARWRTLFVAAGVAIAGAFTWIDGTWPKVAALARRIFGH